MSDKLFTKEEWGNALNTLKDTFRVIVPARDGDFHTFKVLEGGVRPNLDFTNTRLSAKSTIYPQSERMFEYSLNQGDPEAHILQESPKDYTPQVLVGIRPCDAHGFEIVRRNFDNAEFRDPWWVKRHESTTFVGLGCNEPCETCFCSSVGGGPFSEKGLDVLLFDLGESYLAKGLTEKGETLLAGLKAGRETGESDRERAVQLVDQASSKIRDGVPTDKLKEKAINELFDAPFWDEVAFSCLNCGTCTYLCPTCWCFDIQDESQEAIGDRIRNWDSCMFPLFTLHGSGHNPRDKKVQRVRQRFMHKLKYYVDKYDYGVQCSGCGRCVRYCPVNIDIRDVFVLMNNYKRNG